MIKAFIVTFLMLVVALLAYKSHMFDFLMSDWAFYIAAAGLSIVVVAAFIILGNPLKGLKQNDKNGE